MSPAAINEAIAVVTRIPDAAIRRVVAENGGSSALAEKMIARKASLSGNLCECRNEASKSLFEWNSTP
jgi:hypothetical protein